MEYKVTSAERSTGQLIKNVSTRVFQVAIGSIPILQVI